MKLTTPKALAAEAAAKFKKQYSRVIEKPDPSYRWLPPAVYNALLALGENPTPEQVNDAFIAGGCSGGGSWISQVCNECGDSDDTVQLGEEEDYDSRTAYICRDCLKKALALLEVSE